MKLLPVFLFLTISSFAQKKEEFYDAYWKLTSAENARFYSVTEKKDSAWHRSDFFVSGTTLQMDGYYKDKECKIENGDFRYFFANGRLQSAGKYLNGKKEGEWLSYFENGMMYDSAQYQKGSIVGTRFRWHKNGAIADSMVLNSDGSGIAVSWFDNGNPSGAGRYSAGNKMHGKWQFFHKNGTLSATIVFNEEKIISKEFFTEKGEAKNEEGIIEKAAEFPGGTKGWKKYLEKKIRFPVGYKITNSNAITVMISAIIDEEGNITDAYVSTPFDPSFDEIALDVVSKSPKWIPAKLYNRNVKFFIKQPVTFSQPEEE